MKKKIVVCGSKSVSRSMNDIDEQMAITNQLEYQTDNNIMKQMPAGRGLIVICTRVNNKIYNINKLYP